MGHEAAQQSNLDVLFIMMDVDNNFQMLAYAIGTPNHVAVNELLICPIYQVIKGIE